MANKQGKMAGLVNWRLRVTLQDGRQQVGQMLAFDKHMNLVLADTEEFRRVKRKATKGASAPGADNSSAPFVETEEKRALGLIILRGAHVISLSVESPPPADPAARLGTNAPGGTASALAAGAGIARPIGRGAPVGLTGPAVTAASSGFGAPGFPGAPGIGRGAPPPPFGGFPPPGFSAQAPPPPGFLPPRR
ncbi:Small nuclear ribonucleoprotein-associated protein B [Golovinomyces cichoracearum]|uniref:Sm protein B n=1 Tax=Golovinomyces cichoracearum TaxID=62708 RepID=A0A420IDU8_9PEZI|nr:Small nuclear ribonucleoprotein-associated protein B [Golovinomyces cichoracearum]